MVFRKYFSTVFGSVPKVMFKTVGGRRNKKCKSYRVVEFRSTIHACINLKEALSS